MAAEFQSVFTVPALRCSCAAIALLGLLAPFANALSLDSHDRARQTANVFTSVNAGVLLALLLGVLGTTGSARLPADAGPSYRRALTAKARAYGLVGVLGVVLMGALAAAVALPIIHSRGLESPSADVVLGYVQREAIAAVRLAIVGVAIGTVVVGRRRGVLVALSFLALDAIAETYVPAIKNYGPIGALNAFSDPSHHHQLSLGAGATIALAWALLALIAATLLTENRFTHSTTRDQPPSTIR